MIPSLYALLSCAPLFLPKTERKKTLKKPLSHLSSEEKKKPSSAAAPSSKSNPRKDKISVSSVLSAMDNDEEIQPQEQEIGILTAKPKPKSLTSAATLSEKEIKKREKKDAIASQAAELARMEALTLEKLSAAQPKNVPKFIRYRGQSQQSPTFSSGVQERIIRIAEMPVDPLEPPPPPPEFKYASVPMASGPPVMHSPRRSVTGRDGQEWKIPPCVSNWRNSKGYAIPLDKRLAADGRDLDEVHINDNFAEFSEALHVAEQKAREAVAMRSKVQRELMLKEKDRKEQELRALAQKARSERTGAGMRAERRETRKETREERGQRMEREKLRAERRRERRLEARDAVVGKKRKAARDRDRDISENVALGMANTGVGRTGEVMYDQRLFNQEKGMDAGRAVDDQYSIYDKGLFTAQPTLSKPLPIGIYFNTY